MAEWNFNRGEWTEAYVFLKLLGDGRIYGANDDQKKDELTYIDILNIIKDEPSQYLRFQRFVKSEITEIKAFQDDCEFKVITSPDLQEKAQILYDSIKNIKGNRKISVPSIENYLKGLRFTSPKANLSDNAKSLYGAKTDVIVTAKDSLDHSQSIIGFSIKSHIGSSPTLFNSSSSSGFRYRIIGCDDAGMHRLNLLNSFKSIVSAIRNDYKLEYAGCKNEDFKMNLCVVDSQMESILSTAILIFSGYYETGSTNDVTDVCKELIRLNPISINNPEVFYRAKMKDLLFDSFAGMTASTLWNAKKKITGGYIDVDRFGNMLYYRAISDDVFCNYLMANTYFDRPDRGYMFELAYAHAVAHNESRQLSADEINSIVFKNGADGTRKSRKGDFGYVYCLDGEYYIDINFQIRFK